MTPDAIIATFRAMEAEARAEIARKHKLGYAPMTPEDTHAIARAAAEAVGMPWEEARGHLIDSFATLAG